MSLRRFTRMFGCDTARIIKASGFRFLIIGKKRHTKNNKRWYWLRNGKRYDFEYTEEHVAASGRTERELLNSAREYRRLLGKRPAFAVAAAMGVNVPEEVLS